MSKLKLSIVFIIAANIAFIFSNFKLDTPRIVSVNGTTTEILSALGLESNLVGVDITSTYPASIDKLPKVGHNKSISAEGILALNPSTLVGTQGDLKPQTQEQLKAGSLKLQLFKQDFSVEGTKKLIKDMATTFNQKAKGDALIKTLEADLAKVKKPAKKKSVLFIYARGAGTMMVAGKGTPVQKMIELAGGQNAVNDFNDYKPLTAEALVAANPDIILMFDSGLQSMGGINELLKVQGIAETNAGRNKKVIEMDGLLLTGFGPRLGKALIELSGKLQ